MVKELKNLSKFDETGHTKTVTFGYKVKKRNEEIFTVADWDVYGIG